MEGNFDDFDDDIDDNLLRALPLDFPLDEGPEEISKGESYLCGTRSLSPLPINIQPRPGPVLDLRQDFAFPFEPYEIQKGFMKSLYKTLEEGKVGIFESPTGTGKSLSLICGALAWLKDFEEKQRQDLEELITSKVLPGMNPHDFGTTKKTSEPDWITEFQKKKELDEVAKRLQMEREQRLKREARLKELRNTAPSMRFKRKRDVLDEKFEELMKDAPEDLKNKMNAELNNVENVDQNEDFSVDEHLVVEEYHSDDEDSSKKSKDNEEDNDEQEAEEHVTKIYYCSRTHSQLAQFVKEIKKSPHGENTQVVTLGSRQNLCVNDSVRKLKSISMINDRCLELQKNKTKKKDKNSENLPKRKKASGGCPFYRPDAIQEYTDRVLMDVQDIEQLVTLGKQVKACPYYGTRYSVPAAQVVALPYNTLFHKSTREATGIRLKGNIVLIDEAHNLVETISNLHSVEITGQQITQAVSQLSQYMDRYRSRLKAKNLMYIKQILYILNSFIKILGGKPGVPAEQQKCKAETKLRTLNDFLFDAQLDNLNLFKIVRYCERSNITKKLLGFVEKYQPSVVNTAVEKKKEEEQTPTWALSKFLKEISQARDNVQKKPEKPVVVTNMEEYSALFSSPLMHIEGFIDALTNTNKDGRVVVNKQDLLSRSSLKFLLLNPAVHFTDVLSEARAVVVTGGTMQPINEFKEQLFFAAGVQPERILEYSCGHVISDQNLLPISLARGSSGRELDFTYQLRDQPDMMDELGRVVYNVCNIVPGGVVVFFPSYEYERTVHQHWEKAGFLQKVCAKKKIFREPKKATQVEQTLNEYSQCIKRHMANKYSALTGAVLLSVVGGKMSEGINFSDDMARCVIMVGLPYPNMRSPELKEKMDYLNANTKRGPDGRLPGQIHYENLCFKAVNQSIGRAIRHKEDHACILLLDHRYLRPSMRAKLPGWISSRLSAIDRFGPAFAAIRQFFATKKPAIVGSPTKS